MAYPTPCNRVIDIEDVSSMKMLRIKRTRSMHMKQSGGSIKWWDGLYFARRIRFITVFVIY